MAKDVIVYIDSEFSLELGLAHQCDNIAIVAVFVALVRSFSGI